MEAECTWLTLKGKGLCMVNQNLDEYMTKFKKLARQAGYKTLMDTDLVLDLFTSRIPRALYETAYTLDIPCTFDQWKHTLTKWQEKWTHMQGNLDSFHPQTNPLCSHYMPQSSNFTRHHDTMDTTLIAPAHGPHSKTGPCQGSTGGGHKHHTPIPSKRRNSPTHHTMRSMFLMWTAWSLCTIVPTVPK